MATRFPRRAGRFSPRPVKVSRPDRPSPPPATLIDAVLRYHDEAHDQGGGRTLLRLSERRLHEPEVEAALGGDTRRAGRVSILWNERESEIIRVLESALAA